MLNNSYLSQVNLYIDSKLKNNSPNSEQNDKCKKRVENMAGKHYVGHLILTSYSYT